jgi:hypothetical protein
VIVIVARQDDEAALSLTRRWRRHGAALLSPRDLSRCGWRHRLDAPLDGQAVVSGVAVPVSEIQGVVTMLDSVGTADLAHIVAQDRPYVAAEMRAFLLAWLEALPCRVLNRPSTMSLTGCAWRPERWSLAAAVLGIPTAPMPGSASAEDGPENTPAVTYICGETLDAPSPRVAAWVRGLAAAARSRTLVARFCGGLRPWLASVSVVPDLARPEVADVALRWLGAVAP